MTFHRPVGLVELLILYACVQLYTPQASDYRLIFEDWMMCHEFYLFIIIYSFSSRFGNKIDDVSWESVHSGFKQNGLSNVLGLMDLLHSLPPTSVLNETSFNQMKLIKTDRRHRLSQKHLNDLMMIRLQSPSIMDFDPTTAINKWMVSYTVYYNMILIFGV